MIRRLFLVLLAVTPLAAATPSQRVGLPLAIDEVYIPGGEIRPKPRRDREPPLVVRVLEIRPAKDGWRYDFEIHGLEPGIHNVADYLEPADGVAVVELPEIPVEITTALPAGLPDPHPVLPRELPNLGGYRATLIAAAVIWVVGLAGILAWRRTKPIADSAIAPSAATLADRLRPLVRRASSGELTDSERALLERLVIGHWREKLPEIAALPPASVLSELRQHPDAAPLMIALERWLHAPPGEGNAVVIERLLEPYA